jgi:fatty aldehyde-generating acyl-ACP reductase
MTLAKTPPVALLINIGNRTDAARYFKFMKNIPLRVAEKTFLLAAPSVHLSVLHHIETDDQEVSGSIIGIPITPRMLQEMPYEFTRSKVASAVGMARAAGAGVVVLTGLMGGGALGERLIADLATDSANADLILSTGNGYTAAVIGDALLLAAEQRGVNVAHAQMAVVGAAGSIGQGVLETLLGRATFGGVMAFGSTPAAARNMERQLQGRGINATGHADLSDLKHADLVVTATNKPRPILFSEHFKREAIVCDAAVPIAVDKSVRTERPDLFLFQGGAVVPPSHSHPEFGFDFGLPPHTGFACMNEGFLLALSGRRDLATTTRRISVANIVELDHIGRHYGFRTVIKHFGEGMEDEDVALMEG